MSQPRLLRERVVEVGQPLGEHVLDAHLERRAAARDVLGAVVLRRLDVGELDDHVAQLAGARALELLLEARDEHPAAELDHLVAPAAAVERLAVDEPVEVDDEQVAALRGAADRLRPRDAHAQRLELGVDGAGLDLRIAAADLQALVGTELGGRAHADLDRERQRRVVGRRGDDVERGLADRGDAGVVERDAPPALQAVLDGALDDGVATEPLDDHRRRDLALAKARDAQVAAELAGGAVDRATQLVGRDLGEDAHATVRQFGDGGADGGAVHFGTIPSRRRRGTDQRATTVT